MSQQEADEWIEHINQTRLELQDRFLLEMSVEGVEVEVRHAQQMLADIVKGILDSVKRREYSMSTEERIRNILLNFRMQIKQAYERGLIDQYAMHELQNQARLYAQALRESIGNPNIREDIRRRLAHELVDDFYANINHIYEEAISRQGTRKKFSRIGVR